MNISQLAEHLGLAVSTVSRVLSGNAEKYRISNQTADRIREAAVLHQVVPDPLGTSLRKGKSGMIGLLVPDITNPFFAHLARAIELHLRKSRIAVQLCDSAEDPETEMELLENLLQRRLDGMILAPVGVESESLARCLEGSPMPIILMDRIVSGVALPSVSLDHFAAGKLAATTLLQSGHSHLGCLRGSPQSSADQGRLAGVEEAVREWKSPAHLTVKGSGYSLEKSLSEAQALLSCNPRPTAILTLTGQGTLGILNRANDLQIRIPEELSLLAFDNQPWSRLVSPPLATISQPIEKMATRATELLIEALEKGKKQPPPQQILYDAELQLRKSVAHFSADAD